MCKQMELFLRVKIMITDKSFLHALWRLGVMINQIRQATMQIRSSKQ